jgi:transcription antitermination factor NusG
MVDHLLRSKGYESFLPVYASRRKWSDRYKVIEVPLLPGYTFCRLDVERRFRVLITPGVIGAVGVAGKPQAISEEEIATLKAIIRSGFPASPWPFLERGQPIRIVNGPLAGLEGRFLRLNTRRRLVVSVPLLQRSVAVDIQEELVEPLRPLVRVLPVSAFAAFAESHPRELLAGTPVRVRTFIAPENSTEPVLSRRSQGLSRDLAGLPAAASSNHELIADGEAAVS